jgi:hypothetical protein
LNNLLMGTSSLFKCKDTGTCIQHSHKGNRFGYTPSWFICQNSSSNVCPCTHFRYPNIMVVHGTISQDGILLNTLQSILNVLSHFEYMSTTLIPTKTSDLQPFWMTCLWTHLPPQAQPHWHMHWASPQK